MPEWTLRDIRDIGRVQHASTEAALLAMQALQPHIQPQHVLDVGCGSGLLTLAAATLWPETKLVASDISTQAVIDCTANIREHELAERVAVFRSDGLNHSDIRRHGPYDLVLCNLLAELLVSFAHDIVTALDSNGYAVLSGILAWRLQQVKEAYEALGVEITNEVAVEQWRALIIHRQ